MSEIYSKIMDVSPQLAGVWLEHNTRNRKLRKNWVTELTERIKAGKWDVTNDAITFNPDGILTNGQHRLNAIKDSEITVKALVMFNVPDSSNIDCGMNRKTADAIYMGGLADKGTVYTSNQMLGVANLAIAFSRTGTCGLGSKISASDHVGYITKYYEDFNKLNRIYSCRRNGGKGIVNKYFGFSVLCAIHAGEDVDEIANWASIVTTGVPLDGKPSNLNELKNASLYRGAILSKKMSGIETIKKTMTCLNNHLRGKSVAKIYGEMVWETPQE